MNEPRGAIPQHFMCPISLELIEDPVILCTGQTYDRSSIEKWLANGNLTCPVTMQHLHDSTLVPNHTLRHLIHQWLGNDRAMDTRDLPEVNVFRSLKQALQSDESTLHHKLIALDRLLLLSENSRFSNPVLSQMGFISIILELLCERLELQQSQFCTLLVERALLWTTQWFSSSNDYESLKYLNDVSRIQALQLMFEQGNLSIKESLCSLIKMVSQNPEIAILIGNDHNLLKEIVNLLTQNNFRASEAGIEAIHGLCSLQINREKLVVAGAVTKILTFMQNSEGQERSSIPTALEAMALLLQENGAKQTVASHSMGIFLLVKMVFRVSDNGGSKSAVECLSMVCRNSLLSRRKAISAGVQTQLLLLLQSQCSETTKAEAMKLLKLVRSKSAET